ncbi:MAG: AzlC family ABC transporter permease [Lachnospiraceae bacterium]|nr:AzlC family ABC transporter permease [Lachnospiraceae bacterium]
MSTQKLLKTVFLKSLPVMGGYICLGIGFGVLLQKAGYGPLWAFVMSLTIYGGTMQYVGAALIASGADFLTAIITTLAVSARQLFYAVSMLPIYKGAGWKKPYLIFSLTDETYALTVDGSYPEGADEHLYRFLLSVFNQSYWIIGGIIGTIIGARLPFNTDGVDYSMTALFITVFVSQWAGARTHLPALCGLLCTLICLIIFGQDAFLIPSMVSITICLTLLRKQIEITEEKK